MKDAVPYLRHILDAIAAIEEYTAEGKEAFFEDRKTRDVVIRNLEVIGEATAMSQSRSGLPIPISPGGKRLNSETCSSTSTLA